ncbi:MAG: hypothetical protein IPG93_16980, partial [Burkholderiales bacterium]|nr:hypothetical protein [Burkholderiales bacterium]
LSALGRRLVADALAEDAAEMATRLLVPVPMLKPLRPCEWPTRIEGAVDSGCRCCAAPWPRRDAGVNVLLHVASGKG